jgi:hypothetical protein
MDIIAHHYTTVTYDSDRFLPENPQTHHQLYIPAHEIILSFGKSGVRGISQHAPHVAEAKEIIAGKGRGKYIGEISICGEAVAKMLAAYESARVAQQLYDERSNEFSRSLPRLK